MLHQSGRKRGRPKGSKNKPKNAMGVTDLFSKSTDSTLTRPITSPPSKSSIGMPDVFVPMGIPVPSPVFGTYWKFASKRQDLFFAKIRKPYQAFWVDDPVLQKYKFTNAYRASDRVSQYLISNVLYGEPDFLPEVEEVFFRTLMFKIFNRIETWELLQRNLGTISWKEYDFRRYDDILTKAMNDGQKIYSAAYIMPSPDFGNDRKHSNHLMLLSKMINDRLPDRLRQQGSLRHAYESILSYPGIGPFLAYQYTIDLNYGPLLDASENDFVMPGPGALDGIKKCFIDISGYTPADLIRYVHDQQEVAFSNLGIPFTDLWGRPLHLIDCQNLFCEVDKYARVVHPEMKGRSERLRIKQIYHSGMDPIRYYYPPKWGLGDKIAADPRYEKHGTTV